MRLRWLTEPDMERHDLYECGNLVESRLCTRLRTTRTMYDNLCAADLRRMEDTRGIIRVVALDCAIFRAKDRLGKIRDNGEARYNPLVMTLPPWLGELRTSIFAFPSSVA